MPQTGTSENILLSKLQSGDTKSFSLLYERYWEHLYIQAYKRIGDEDAAKDVIQNVFINIWQKRETLQITTSLENYLYTAVKFQVFSFFRSEKVKDKLMAETLHRFQESTAMDDLNGYFELEAMIASEVALLPDHMKAAYLLKAARHSTSEIAQQLNLKEQTVSNHLSEALRRIRIKLGSRYPEWMISILLLLLKV